LARDILIVDDEADIRESLSGILSDEGYAARLATDSRSALLALEEHEPSLVVLDIWLENSELDGLELLGVIRADYPNLPVIMISGHGNIETAVSAIQRGAYDFVEKPFAADRLLLVVSRAIEASRLRRENEELRMRFGQDSDVLGSRGAPPPQSVAARPRSVRRDERSAHGARHNRFGTLWCRSRSNRREQSAQGRDIRAGASRYAVRRRGRRHAA
jgi:FixJ family two-component response regulator